MGKMRKIRTNLRGFKKSLGLKKTLITNLIMILAVVIVVVGCSNSYHKAESRIQAQIIMHENNEGEILNAIDKILIIHGFRKKTTSLNNEGYLIYFDAKHEQQKFYLWKINSVIYLEGRSMPLGLTQSGSVMDSFRAILRIENYIDVEISHTFDETKMIKMPSEVFANSGDTN